MAFCKSLRQQHVLLHRSAHCRDAHDLVHRRADNREVQPLVASDVTVEDLADMEPKIDLSGRQPGVERSLAETVKHRGLAGAGESGFRETGT
jgi:hypothetical protein